MRTSKLLSLAPPQVVGIFCSARRGVARATLGCPRTPFVIKLRCIYTSNFKFKGYSIKVGYH